MKILFLLLVPYMSTQEFLCGPYELFLEENKSINAYLIGVSKLAEFRLEEWITLTKRTVVEIDTRTGIVCRLIIERQKDRT